MRCKGREGGVDGLESGREYSREAADIFEEPFSPLALQNTAETSPTGVYQSVHSCRRRFKASTPVGDVFCGVL